MKKKIITMILAALLASSMLFSVSGCGSEKDKEASAETETSAETQKDTGNRDAENNSGSKKSTTKILDGKGISLNNDPISAPADSSQEEAAPVETPETEVPDNTQENNTSEIPDPLTGTEERRDLSTEELDYFSSFVSDMENYGFLCSSYSIPQEVDLDQVLYTGAGMDFEPLTFEESAALQAASGQPFMTDVIHLTSQQIEDFLQRKLGISLGEVRKFNWTYLEQFDSYYVEHGDTNRVTFTCTGGWTEDGMYYLDCQSSDGAMHTALTLEKSGDTYLFRSNILQ